MKTCSVRRDQYQSDNCETNGKLNPLYTLSTMTNNIFHDIIISYYYYYYYYYYYWW